MSLERLDSESEVVSAGSRALPPPFRGVGPAEVRAGAFAALPAVLADFGLDAQPLLAEVGLPADLLADLNTPMPYARGARVFAAAARDSGCPYIGLLFGDRGGSAMLGPLATLMLQAPDLGTALRAVVDGLHLHDRGGVATLRIASNTAYLGYTVVEPGAEGVEIVVDVALALTHRLLREWCGSSWHAREVRLARRRPAQVARYREVFRCPVFFNAERSEVAFDGRCLAWPPPGAPARQSAEFARQRAAFLALNDLPLPETLRRLLHAALAERIVTVEDAAARLGLHPRTLNRRLAAEGVNFRQIKASAQFEAARLLLRSTDLPLEAVGAALGYAELSSFSRSFTAWAGCSPSVWRRRAAQN
ncbi:MAG: AraC family transcriptional regulator [Betaproteobacteria bacterium]